MFSAITVNDQRKTYLNFTSNDIYSYPAALVTSFDDKTVYLDFDEELKEKKIGIVKGSGLGAYIEANNPDHTFVKVDSTQKGFTLLAKGKIDLFAINTVTAKYFIEKKGFHNLKIGLILNYRYHLKIAVSKSLPIEAISILDKAINSIDKNTLKQIFNKWTKVSVKKETDWDLIIKILSVVFLVIVVLIWNTRRLNQMVKKRTDELSDTIKELDVALLKAQDASNAKSLFLANMSHEIRTPMNGVLGLIQVLRDTSLDGLQKHYLEALDSSSKSLLLLIDDLLDISKIESGKLLLNIEPFKTFEWVTDIQNINESLFENKQVQLVTEISEALPKYLEGDATRLLQIATNLLSNAAKYTQEGEVKLVIGGDMSSSNQFNLSISVVDTGAGIPQEKLDVIFDSFLQLNTDRTANQRGAGLGLAICKRLADLMHGSIKVTSEVGKGSCFTFQTTLQTPDTASLQTETQGVPGAEKNISILLVDDEPINRLAARALLEQQGHRVTEAENGQQALDAFNEQTFDLILMDIHMPVMDGVATTREIRKHNTSVPIVALSASVMNDEKELYLKTGMNAVVEKPILFEKLRTTLEQVIH